jgi:hypothetical protein
MPPSGKCFDADDRPVRQRDLGLVDGDDLALIERVPQFVGGGGAGCCSR